MKTFSDRSARMISLIGVAFFMCLTALASAHRSGFDSDDKVDAGAKKENECLLSALRDHNTEAPIVGVLLRAKQIGELRDGYELRFKGDDNEIKTLIEFVLSERKCCSFLTLGLIFESEERGVRLQIRGGAGIKDLVKLLLPEHLPLKSYSPEDER